MSRITDALSARIDGFLESIEATDDNVDELRDTVGDLIDRIADLEDEDADDEDAPLTRDNLATPPIDLATLTSISAAATVLAHGEIWSDLTPGGAATRRAAKRVIELRVRLDGSV